MMEWVWSAMCSQPMTADWPTPPCAAPLDGLFRSGCARILEENCGVRWRSRPPAALLAFIFSVSKARAARGPLLKGYIMSLFDSPCLSMFSFLFLTQSVNLGTDPKVDISAYYLPLSSCSCQKQFCNCLSLLEYPLLFVWSISVLLFIPHHYSMDALLVWVRSE